ncbi:hypothetical protein [Myxococcus sp. SDU36]|uniref:hypothetical protein n=1 Tax=Myxococcus sp. SDU36 TaxID=2831967 RepID=UPI0025428090|nr:hypothetical protein [Myxococcus sp. SDU36]WIG96073.1 hypothetical protein KGD87_00995 [Myxococcus sp. SDU36]
MGVTVLSLMSSASPASRTVDEAPRPSLSESDRADLVEFLDARTRTPPSEETLADIATEPFGARYLPTPSASKTKARMGTCSCQHRDVHTSAKASCLDLRKAGVCAAPYKGTGMNKAQCQNDARDNAGAKCKNCLGHCHFTPAK